MPTAQSNRQGSCRTDRTNPGSTPSPVESLAITVLAGGPSAEREVSLESGRAVFGALQRLGHKVTLCDISPDDLSALDHPADFVFIALHGEFGEDGVVQCEMDSRGMVYSGCGAVASCLAMDKAATKRRLLNLDIPTPPYAVVDQASMSDVVARFGAPAVVKPVASGSSVDTYIAKHADELRRVVPLVVDRYGDALIERFIDGPELTVGVLDGQALPVCEIRTDREFYDYQAKYHDDGTRYIFDSDLPPSLLERVQSMAVAAHRALGCSVLSRVDFMVGVDVTEGENCEVNGATLQPFVIELNTIPGFTSHSLVPKAAARVGIDFEDLCQRIVELSMRNSGQSVEGADSLTSVSQTGDAQTAG